MSSSDEHSVEQPAIERPLAAVPRPGFRHLPDGRVDLPATGRALLRCGVLVVGRAERWLDRERWYPAGRSVPRSRAKVFSQHGESAFAHLPTIFLWHHSDAFVRAVCWAGVVAAALVVAGVAQGPLLLAMWLGYLSLANVGGIFMGYQWDALLLETGLLAVLAAPWRWFSGRIPAAATGPAALRLAAPRLVVVSPDVLFRVGQAGERRPDVANATALTFHYETQPLPTWIGWWAHQLPARLQIASCWIMFSIELALPFAIFLGRWGRLAACTGFTALMALILLTGNYTFFNVLAVALAITLLDDSWWPGKLKRWLRCPEGERQATGSIRSLGSGRRRRPLFALSLVVLAESVGWPPSDEGGWLARQARAVREATAPFHLANSYGLFAVMTTERNEIIIEVSADGTDWHELNFRWKPGDVSRPPAFVAPHQPRLDWQMWFAALHPSFIPQRDITSPRMAWFARFLECLLDHKQPVWNLLGPPPIPVADVRHVRCVFYQYHFTDLHTRRATGAWWSRDPEGPRLSHVSIPERTGLRPIGPRCIAHPAANGAGTERRPPACAAGGRLAQYCSLSTFD